MTNNELNQIKDSREKFYTLRKELIGASCKEVKERNLKIRKFVLELLEDDGFKLDDLGTQYLATLITLYYHERRMFRRKDIEDKSYWDLSKESNEHYNMLGNTSENAIELMGSAISENKRDNGPLEEIVYDIADYTCYIHNRDDRRVRYADVFR